MRNDVTTANNSPGKDQPEVRDLRPGLLEADDQKIRRVLAVVDGVSDPSVNKALLDTLRPRLAVLKPIRPLRFARLLFMPIDPLTVPARAWRPGDPTIPRTALAPIVRMVRARLGDQATIVDRIIAGRKTDATHVITQAGEILWSCAAEILAAAPPPSDWQDTGLPLSVYQPLACSIAAVLRRAQRLRSLARDEELGALALDDDAVKDIVENIANEPKEGCAMIARLILLRSPHAIQILRHIVGSGRTAEARGALRHAIDRGLEAVLTQMERESGFAQEIGNGDLAEVGGDARRVTTLLRAIEAEQTFAGQWPRLKAIRVKLDDACRTRFARGLKEGLIASLATASGPVDAAGQTELESSARNLRKLETVARKLGGSPNYDQMLLQAADAVRMAADAGTLTPMRNYRLIEILAGSAAAEALYNQAIGVV